MTAYADLDTSVIDELPPGRTLSLPLRFRIPRRHEIIDRVAQRLHNRGRPGLLGLYAG